MLRKLNMVILILFLLLITIPSACAQDLNETCVVEDENNKEVLNQEISDDGYVELMATEDYGTFD